MTLNPYDADNQPWDFESWSQAAREDWFQQWKDAEDREAMLVADPSPWWAQ